MPTDLAEEMVLEIIRAFARRNSPGRFNIIFKRVAGTNGLSYAADRHRYDNFFGICKGRFFGHLGTNKNDWKSWPEKARRYLKIPEKPASQPKPIALPTQQQRRIPF